MFQISIAALTNTSLVAKRNHFTIFHHFMGQGIRQFSVGDFSILCVID